MPKEQLCINTKFIDAFRFLLALWVCVGHFYIFIGGPNCFTLPIIGRILLSNGVAVDGFIVITGFLMTFQYLKREEQEPVNRLSTAFIFYIRRLFRLYPVYLVSIIIAFIFYNDFQTIAYDALLFFTNNIISAWGQETGFSSRSWSSLFTHLTFLHGFIPNHVSDILSPAWSLALEAQYYLVFPLLFLFSIGKKRNMGTILLMLCSLIPAIYSPKLFGLYLNGGLFAHFGQPSLLLYKLPLFVLGMVSAFTVTNRIHFFFLPIALIFVFSINSWLTIMVIVSFEFSLFVDKLNLFGGIVSNFVNRFQKLLSINFFTIGANLSYSMYLFHMIILFFSLKAVMVLDSQFNINKTTAIVFSFSLFMILTIVTSHLSYSLLEKRFILIGKKIINKYFPKKDKCLSAVNTYQTESEPDHVKELSN